MINVKRRPKPSRFFAALKPNLLLCKFFGVCSVSNVFRSSHPLDLSFKLFSFDTFYSVSFILACEFLIPDGIKSITNYNTLNLKVILSIYHIAFYLMCIFSGKQCVALIKRAEEADVQMKYLANRNSSKLSETGFELVRVLSIIVFDAFLYLSVSHKFLINCSRGTLAILFIYKHMPYLLMVSLFCTISKELGKRFQTMAKVLEKNSKNGNNPEMIEVCRLAHTNLLSACEIFMECFSIIITSLFVIRVVQVVFSYGFPCFYGKGCSPFVLVQSIAQKIFLIFIICHSSAKLNEKNENILDSLNSIRLSNSRQQVRDQIRLFSAQVLTSHTKFSAMGFFELDNTTVLTVISVLLMLTVVIAQSANKLEQIFSE